MPELEEPPKYTKGEDESEKEDKEPTPLASLQDVYSFGKNKFWLVVGGFFCSAVTGCVLPAVAFIFATSFEAVGASTSSEDFLADIRRIAFTLMILGAFAFTFMTGQAALLETASDVMTRDLKDKWFRALLRQDMAFFDIKDVSGTATIISSNGAKFKKGLGRKSGEMVMFSFTCLGGLGYAFWASWRTSLIMLAVVPVMTLSTLFVLKINTTQSSRASKTYAEAGGIVYSTILSLRTILSLNAIPTMLSKFHSATQKASDGATGLACLLGIANGSLMGSMLLSYLVIILYGSYLLYKNISSTGCDPSATVSDNVACDPRASDIFGSLMGMTFVAAVLPQVSASIEAVTGARAACYPALVAMRRKVGDETEGECKGDDDNAHRRGSTMPLPKYVIDSSSEEGLKPTSVNGEIIFDNVTFAYPTRPEATVFNGFSLRIEAGKTVALVGASGSGKSTSAQLIERFYDPFVGSVMFDGNNLTSLNVKWLRSQIGLVSQEPSLFACSIRENILYGKPGATQEEVEQAARSANAHDFIAAFPDGYDTQVGDKGAQLSGGQKQRIAIARVLIKQPKILLLDEATSALDSESEAIVQEALDELLQTGGRTTIVIAHRLSTVRNADMIAVVGDGMVVETGSHEELISKQGHYYKLVEAQKGRKDQESDTVSNPSSRSASVHGGEGSSTFYLGEDSAMFSSAQDNVLMRFRDLHFCYPSRPDNRVLRAFNLNLYKGETLALVGPSGHGKSTVMQLIERFYDPDRGTVELNGVDIKDINVSYLRSQIGLVSQEPVLFDCSIRENILYGKPDATQEEVEEAAKAANCHNFITEFPDGYDTQVGSSGSQLSGGEKQRVAIARALIKKPEIMLLDEATSALDTASEKIVQDALDKIMSSKTQTTVVIAHRLSTIRNADRIAVIEDGKVREIGSHDELMAKPDGRYHKLHMFQDLDADQAKMRDLRASIKSVKSEKTIDTIKTDAAVFKEKELDEIDKVRAKSNANRAWKLAWSKDRWYFFVGGIGAIMAGLMFPGFGFIFAYMIELLFTPIFPCVDPPDEEGFCQNYYDSEAESMRETSFKVAYGCLGIIAMSIIGNMLLFYGFNVASERMNKRVRDAAFESLVRQEVGYFDLHPVAVLTSRLSDDAALLHSFSGEPIRTLLMNLASVFVGLVVSFNFMWPFALLTLGILPFMSFGAIMEMKMYMGEDAVAEEKGERTPGAIVVETLLNMRTVASLSMEAARAEEFDEALASEDPRPVLSNALKGSASGLGQFVQMWGYALMFWWGGWLLLNYPNSFTFRDWLISMFGLMFSLSGTAVAAQGATNRDKAKLAADRIFELIDRESAIDPLGEGVIKGVENGKP